MRRAIFGCVLAVGLAIGAGPPVGAVTTTWTVTSPVPAPSQQTGLSAVSCATSTFCVAVGEDDARQAPVIEVWNGSAWSSATPAPVPPGQYGALYSVSCTSPTFCIAVGARGTTHPVDTFTLAEVWDGASWSVLTSQNPGSQFNQFESISCVSPTACAAVGGQGELASLPMVQTWDGFAWTVRTQPTTAGGLLEGVSCIPTFCISVGTDDSSRVLVERWNGSTLSLVAAPPAVGTYNYALGVSCVPRHWCAAVGFATEGSQTIAVHYTWDGTSWTTAEDLVAGYNSSLARVACLARNDCVATGGALPTGATRTLDFPLLETWNGRAWKRNRLPTLRRASIGDASCTSDTTCIAVGGYEPARKTFVPYALAND